MHLKRPRLKTVLLTPVVLLVLFYITALIVLSSQDVTAVEPAKSSANGYTVAIFGASGTAGDGILKAALASSDIEQIHVLTRRTTPRIEAGVASGKVRMTLHMDYLDYSVLREQIADVEAVYWAIGVSSVGMDEKTYGMIHVDFPMQFVAEWMRVSELPDVSFHYISSSDITAESSAMWAREKVRAEKSLFALAEGSNIRVIAYRPDYIGPTEEEANLGQNLLFWFFKPLGAAIRATQIGQAMIDVTVRGAEFQNGDKLATGKITRYSNAYEQRMLEKQ
jgi:hypothetical protein